MDNVTCPLCGATASPEDGRCPSCGYPVYRNNAKAEPPAANAAAPTPAPDQPPTSAPDPQESGYMLLPDDGAQAGPDGEPAAAPPPPPVYAPPAGQQPPPYANTGVPAYGAPPYPGATGPASGGYIPPAGAGYPAYTSPPQKPTNTRRVVVVILVVVALALVLSIVGGIGMFSAISSISNGYETLKSEICRSQTTAEAAGYQEQLTTFNATNSGIVEEELIDLVSTCHDYEYETENAILYEQALISLGLLSHSSDSRIASCAERLRQQVQEDQERHSVLDDFPFDDFEDYFDDDYWGFGKEGSGDNKEDFFGDASPDTGEPPNYYGREEWMTTPMEVANHGLGTLQQVDGQAGFSFTADNVTGRDIEYFELMVYCYGRDYKPVQGADGHTWAWCATEQRVPVDGRFTPQDVGWTLEGFPNVAYVVPYVTYVRCSDGFEWGLTEKDQMLSPNIISAADSLQAYADMVIAYAEDDVL